MEFSNSAKLMHHLPIINKWCEFMNQSKFPAEPSQGLAYLFWWVLVQMIREITAQYEFELEDFKDLLIETEARGWYEKAISSSEIRFTVAKEYAYRRWYEAMKVFGLSSVPSDVDDAAEMIREITAQYEFELNDFKDLLIETEARGWYETAISSSEIRFTDVDDVAKKQKHLLDALESSDDIVYTIHVINSRLSFINDVGFKIEDNDVIATHEKWVMDGEIVSTPLISRFSLNGYFAVSFSECWNALNLFCDDEKSSGDEFLIQAVGSDDKSICITTDRSLSPKDKIVVYPFKGEELEKDVIRTRKCLQGFDSSQPFILRSTFRDFEKKKMVIEIKQGSVSYRRTIECKTRAVALGFKHCYLRIEKM